MKNKIAFVKKTEAIFYDYFSLERLKNTGVNDII